MVCRSVLDCGIGHTLLSSVAAVRTCARCCRVYMPGPHAATLGQHLALNKCAVICERLKFRQPSEIHSALSNCGGSERRQERTCSSEAWDCLLVQARPTVSSASCRPADFLQWAREYLALPARVVVVADAGMLQAEWRQQCLPHVPFVIEQIAGSAVIVFDL